VAADIDAMTVEATGARPANLWRDTAANILRQRNAIVGLTILVILVLVALFADQLARWAPDTVLLDKEEGVRKLMPPCIHALGCPTTVPEHFLGTDTNVRDLWSRVIHGARISLQIGFITVGFAIVLGSVIGAISGFVGRWVDNIVMRFMDVILAFPALLLAILIVTVLGSGIVNAQLAIGIVAIPVYARIMRASVLSVKGQDYVTATRALGASETSILLRRVIPNALTPIVVAGTLDIGGAVLNVAALSFLGIGAQPPLAEWGSMIGLERGQLFNAPWLIFAPGIALAFTVFGFNLLGDGLRDALDPRLNR
jgi:peptide/nickel transport system permease protein